VGGGWRRGQGEGGSGGRTALRREWLAAVVEGGSGGGGGAGRLGARLCNWIDSNHIK
jgi:hypothetical protein